jgi:acetylornithine deacetylase
VRTLREALQAAAGGEAATQQWIAARLERLGCRVDHFSFSPVSLQIDYEFADSSLTEPATRTAIVGGVPGSGGRSLLLFAHSDCEPVGDLTGWRHAPFAGEVEGGRLYGWGIADDLAGIAAMLCALETLSAGGLRPGGAVTLASAPSKRHARGIVAVLDHTGRADAALYLHPAESGHGLRDIKAITPGILRFLIAVEGRPAPTAEPEQAPFHHAAFNPIERAWEIARALKALGERRARERGHPLADGADARSTNLQLAYVQSGSRLALNRVPGSCDFAGSISFPPGDAVRDVQQRVEHVVRLTAAQDPWLRQSPPRLEWLEGTAGAEIPLDHPLYRAVSTAIHAATGIAPAPYALHAASDIRHPILRAGIPCVGIGSLAGDLAQGGGADEWVDVDDFVRFVHATTHVIIQWCGVRAV